VDAGVGLPLAAPPVSPEGEPAAVDASVVALLPAAAAEPADVHVERRVFPIRLAPRTEDATSEPQADLPPGVWVPPPPPPEDDGGPLAPE
jgi:hypothetical protein